jgi:hypothetical protein
MPRSPVLVGTALAALLLAACGTATTTTASSPGTASQGPAVVMAAICTVQTMPTPGAAASAAFFSVHDSLHGLAAELDAAGHRAVAADVLQATAAVEAHVEGTETSVPWPTATRNLVTTIQGAYATLGEQAPTCS